MFEKLKMKNALLNFRNLVLCLIVFLTVKSNQSAAQTTTYQPFPINYGLWHYAFYDDFGNYTGQQKDLVLLGDTLIGAVLYSKIYHNGTSYEGALREQGKKVFYHSKNAGSERLLYDFNLTVGDTFVFINDTANVSVFDTVIVVQEYTTTTSKGPQRTLTFNWGTTWIEGIGNLENLLKPTVNHSISARYYLECMRSDTGFVYPAGAACILSSSEINISKSQLEIYPNPSIGLIKVESKNYNLNEIRILNVLGQEVKRFGDINAGQISIEGLKPGIYFLKIKDESGAYFSRKVEVMDN